MEAPDNRLRMHELASSVLLTRGGVTRLVTRLESEGFITREPDPDDLRGTYAVLTPEGREALRKAWPVYASSIHETFASHLSNEETKVIGSALERVVQTNRVSAD